MSSQDKDRQDEQIIRRAEELGHDPTRVARALNQPIEDHEASHDAPAEEAFPTRAG